MSKHSDNVILSKPYIKAPRFAYRQHSKITGLFLIVFQTVELSSSLPATDVGYLVKILPGGTVPVSLPSEAASILTVETMLYKDGMTAAMLWLSEHV